MSKLFPSLSLLAAAVSLATSLATSPASADARPAFATSDSVARWTCIHIPGAGTYCGDDGYNDDERPRKK